MDCILNGVSAYGILWALFAVGYRINNGGKNYLLVAAYDKECTIVIDLIKNVEKFIFGVFF